MALEENPQQRGPAVVGAEGKKGMEQVRSFWTALAGRLEQMAPEQRRRLYAAMGCALACLAALTWYATRTDWRVLYAGLESSDAREIAAELTAANIPFDVSPDGATLRVPEPNLDKARLATTAKGGPKSGRMGFELFDKPNWIGSDFDEKVNYQRALEGELEHTIDTLSAVESARVHVVMPHDSLFTDQQRDSKASVVLRLRHSSLSNDEADSIRNLVASAVDDLKPENVALVDSEGRSLGRKSGDAETAAHEQLLADKLIETLEPVAGAGNVRASVNVEYDTSTADEVDETYDPNSVVTLAMQRSEQTSGTQPVAAGVPGTASNAPNVKPPLFPTQNSGQQSAKQESSNYGASKRTRHMTQGSGKIRRITAAVLINDRMTVNGKKIGWQQRTPAEMKQLSELAEAAVGYDQARGDQVSVENIGFDSDAGKLQEGFAERVRRTASDWQVPLKYLSILIGMLALVLLVLRPLVRNVTAAPQPQFSATADESLLPEATQENAPTSEQTEFARQKQHAQLVFDTVAEQLRKEPQQTTRLLQSWIHTE
ncbi:MAG: flagellar M-ring protein FliF [Acidobacteria bacterium]|nr:flagellar M-ring protein FliF [Acidobacteriota bacterium]MBW4046059.1 flagellar M-ring protein FliF [Acidobacteriota bacterium]